MAMSEHAICCGAEPLLDYVAMPKDDPNLWRASSKGLPRGAKKSTALIGGETAILGGMYNPGEYDLAGFCVGVAERANILMEKRSKEATP